MWFRQFSCARNWQHEGLALLTDDLLNTYLTEVVISHHLYEVIPLVICASTDLVLRKLPICLIFSVDCPTGTEYRADTIRAYLLIMEMLAQLLAKALNLGQAPVFKVKFAAVLWGRQPWRWDACIGVRHTLLTTPFMYVFADMAESLHNGSTWLSQCAIFLLKVM